MIVKNLAISKVFYCLNFFDKNIRELYNNASIKFINNKIMGGWIMETKERSQSKLPIFVNSLFFLMFFILGYLTCALEAITTPVKIIIICCVTYLSVPLTKWIFRRTGISK